MSNLRITSMLTSSARYVTGAIAKALPGKTVENLKVNKAIGWIGKNISSPQNRLILGASALLSQPYIDLSNKKVDEETRKISAIRTVAKIIAGTLTGVFVRLGCIHAVDAFCKVPAQITKDMKFKSYRKLFTPIQALTGKLKNTDRYKKAFGTLLSLGVMVFTNFLIDAPLTKYLTNKFADNLQARKEAKTKVNKEVKHE